MLRKAFERAQKEALLAYMEEGYLGRRYRMHVLIQNSLFGQNASRDLNNKIMLTIMILYKIYKRIL